MKQFSDFNIQIKEANFTGDQIKLNQILNVEIIVHAYRIKDSIKKEGTQYLTLSIELKDKRYVLFTSGVSLIHSIKQITDFPFKTTIVMINDRCEFS